MRREWEPEDLIACWTLVDGDAGLVGNKSGPTRLGFVLLQLTAPPQRRRASRHAFIVVAPRSELILRDRVSAEPTSVRAASSFRILHRSSTQARLHACRSNSSSTTTRCATCPRSTWPATPARSRSSSTTLSPVDQASVSITQFDALGPDARVIEGNPSGALCKYAIAPGDSCQDARVAVFVDS